MAISTSGFPEIFHEMILRKKIHYNTEMVSVVACFDICKITNPDMIRSLLVEILLEMIGEFAIFILFVRMKRLLDRHLW